jgi:ribosome maturation factor RimP
MHFSGARVTDIAAITDLVEPEARALGFDLVRVRWFGGGANDSDGAILQIMAERPATGQLTIDDCAALSRRISEVFDGLEESGKDPIPEAYRLEVSSPGIDRPLTRLKDFADWTGHDARVTLTEGVDGRKNLSGRIDSLDGDRVHMTDRKSGALAFAFADVADAKLVLTDRLIAATRPLDTTGADEIVETELEETTLEDLGD